MMWPEDSVFLSRMIRINKMIKMSRINKMIKMNTVFFTLCITLRLIVLYFTRHILFVFIFAVICKKNAF